MLYNLIKSHISFEKVYYIAVFLYLCSLLVLKVVFYTY